MKTYAHYKHYIGLSSQISFCQVPLRLDVYNQCNFSCSYCFAKSRGGNRGPRKIQISRSENLSDRMTRVANGEINSAVDEFIDRRIPIQLGGMTDPFSPLEARHRAALKHLEILADYDYPTLISTKSAYPVHPQYAEQLHRGNFLVRFSISAIDASTRSRVENGCPTPAALFTTIEKLTHLGILCSVRLQPIFPGHEESVFDLLAASANAGARHVTFEFLKLPIDEDNAEICRLNTKGGEKLKDVYLRNRASKHGRELVLPPSYKMAFLSEAGQYAREIGLTVGYGDNEFLPYSDSQSCCNGADLYLRKFNLFRANAATAVRKSDFGSDIRFENVLSEWMPRSSVSTYMNSRVRVENPGPADWRDFAKRQWRPGALYGPDYFFGVEYGGRTDATGQPIYTRSNKGRALLARNLVPQH